MTDANNLPRLYDEKEVGKLLERATELQREDPVRAAASGGLSLAELEEIAAEAGIDPRLLRRAAAEMASSRAEPEGWERITGERLTLMHESVVAGELTEEGFERVVEAIQRTAQEHGQPSLLGRTLTWQAETAGKTRTIQATVTSRDGQTYMRVVERLHQMASGLFAGTVAGAGVGLGMAAGVPLAINVLGSGLLAFAFPMASVGLTLMACREIYRRIVRKREKAITAMMAAMVESASQSIADHAFRNPEPPPELPRG